MWWSVQDEFPVPFNMFVAKVMCGFRQECLHKTMIGVLKCEPFVTHGPYTLY
jgi:hypothetical protein